MQLGQRGVGRRRSSRECGVRRGTRIYGFAKRVELLKGDVPFACEDIACKLSPVCGQSKVRVGGEDTEVIEVICSSAVVTIGILELTKVVQGVDLF